MEQRALGAPSRFLPRGMMEDIILRLLQVFRICGWLGMVTQRPGGHTESHDLCFLSWGRRIETKCSSTYSCPLGMSTSCSLSLSGLLSVCVFPFMSSCLCVCVSPSLSTPSSTGAILSTLLPRANQETDISFNRHNFHAAGSGATSLPFRIVSFGGQGGYN